jgi:hypothetical protein
MRDKCKHFSGPVHNKACKAGIDYRALVGGPDLGWMARLPCIPDSPLKKSPVAKCESYASLTPEEIATQEKEIKDRSQFIITAIKDIKATKLAQGSIVCPKCAGDLNFSVAKLNGHIWGRCLTADCLQWVM